MKNLLTIVAIAASALLSACGTSPLTPIGAGTAPVQTPAQIAAKVQQICPDIQVTLTNLSALILPPTVAVDLQNASLAVNLVCGIGATVNLTNIQTVLATALPALVSAIKVSGMSTAAQNNAVLLITGAEIIMNGILAANTPIPVAAPAPASAASK